MSATLKHDVGQGLIAYFHEYEPNLWDLLKPRNTSRYAGTYRDRWECATFSLAIPKHIATAWDLFRHCSRWQVKHPRPNILNGLHVLASKLYVALGVPAYVATGEEAAFLTSIDESPGDLSIWMGYADWLRERDDKPMFFRGELIAGLLGKKSLEYRYGVPPTQWHDETRWNFHKNVPDYKKISRQDFIGESIIIPNIFEEMDNG